MVEIENKYKIYNKKFGYINWSGFYTLYKKEILRFLKVAIQTIISPLVTSLLFLMVLSLAIGNERGEALGYPFITFLISTQTGKSLSFSEKNKSNFVKKEPPLLEVINVCASGSVALPSFKGTQIRFLVFDLPVIHFVGVFS